MKFQLQLHCSTVQYLSNDSSFSALDLILKKSWGFYYIREYRLTRIRNPFMETCLQLKKSISAQKFELATDSNMHSQFIKELNEYEILASIFRCHTHQHFSTDVSFRALDLILKKPWGFRHKFGILSWKHVGDQKILAQSSKNWSQPLISIGIPE